MSTLTSLRSIILTAVAVAMMVWPLVVLYRWTQSVSATEQAKQVIQPAPAHYVEVGGSRFQRQEKPAVRFEEAIVSITFDDGWLSAYSNALPLLEEYGFEATYFVTRDFIDTAGYKSTPQLNHLLREGHDISAHSVTHPDLTKVDADELVVELLGAKQWLESNSYQAADFATPFSSYNDAVLDQVRRFYRSHRTTNPGVNTKSNIDRYQILSPSVRNNTSLREVEEWIDEAIASRGWLVLNFHQIDDTEGEFTSTSKEFEAILQLLRDKQVSVAKYGRVIDALVELEN